MNLYPHQQRGIDFVVKRGGSGALFHGMGTGKTLSALSLYKKLRESDPFLKLLVICPLSLIQHTWIEHIEKFFPEFKYCNLRDDTMYGSDTNIFLINYETLIRKHSLDKFIQLWLSIHPRDWMAVIDESSKLKSATTQITKACLFLRDKFKYRVCLSGLPAPNNELEYYGQLTFIAREALGVSFTQFRNTYFYLADRYGRELAPTYSREGMSALFVKHGAHYVANKHKQRELMLRIGQYAHFVSMEEALPDLPPLVEEVRSVELKSDQMRLYKEMKKHLIIEIREEEITAANALTKLLKLRQITSGFIFNELGEEMELEIDGDPSKIKELKATVEQIGADQAIIWCNFKWEIRTIEKLLNEIYGEWAPAIYPMPATLLKPAVSTLYSGTEDRDQSIADFKSGKTKFLVANPQSGGLGLNLQHCHIEIYYSVNYSLELMDQSQKRIHRGGQTKKCTAIYLLADQTIDFDIYNIVHKKKSLDEVLKGYLK